MKNSIPFKTQKSITGALILFMCLGLQSFRNDCGGNVVFKNNTGKDLNFFGANFPPNSQFHTCDYPIKNLAPGESYSVNVPKGQVFSYSFYWGSCSYNNIKSYGSISDCQAVNQTITVN